MNVEIAQFIVFRISFLYRLHLSLSYSIAITSNYLPNHMFSVLETGLMQEWIHSSSMKYDVLPMNFS